MRIAAITMVYNEASILPYFLRHYEYLDQIYVLYERDSTDDTLKILERASNVVVKDCHAEGGLDDVDKVELTNNTLHTIKADWVYVVDCDEFILPPREAPEDFLSRQDGENYNVVRAGMFQVYRHRTDKDLDPSLPPIPQRVHGDPDLFSTVRGPNKDSNANYVKPIVVKPSDEIRFLPGNHVVEGQIRISPELYLGAHWQMADPSIAVDRRIKNRIRMSERNKRLGMGYQHWDVTEEWIRAECDRHLDDPLIEELELFSNKTLKNHELLTMRVMYRATVFELERQLEKSKRQVEDQKHQLERQKKQLQELKAEIYQIRASIPMQLVNRYQTLVDKLMRPGTRRRHYYELGLTGVRVILAEGWRSFFKKAWARLTRRSAAIKERRRDLPKFNASISQKEADKLVFPLPPEEPEVSIVIAAYNNWKYTLNCLKSIAENTDGDYEVVVIDDASTDETAEVLSKVQNLHLITNKENAGFLESCNRGATASKGQYILFLNNDTLVTKGWLPPLLEILKREDVGAVGSKLVYPDGTLQEAGSVVWSDGSAWNYGRGDDPNKPEYNHVREVDYCSGASLAVKRELFEKVGRFDEMFKPAYSEDSDLCFSFRRLGYKVMYQPASMVVHFLGVSCGRDLSRGVKKYQEINRAKFVEKWRFVLQEDHYAPGAENLFLAREKISGKRIERTILVIDSMVPEYDRNAGALTTHQYTKLFVDLGFKVIFLPGNLRGTEPYTSELQQYGIEVIYGWFDFDSWLRQNGKHINYVWLSRPNVSIQYIDKVKEKTRAKILYYVQDLHYLRMLRKYELEGSKQALKESQRLKEIELMLFNSADAVLTPSTFEAATISGEIAEEGKVYVIPPSFYEEFPSNTDLPTFDDRKDIAFLGGFKHGPNADAVTWFVKECLPRIASQVPDLKFFVIGSDPPKEIVDLQSENVVVAGYVKDLKEYFQKIRLCVAPVRWGAGVKVKILTSMYYGVPVVTTSLGAEGTGLVDGENVLIADTPEDFVARVVELYSNKNMWEKLSRNGLQYLKECFSKKAAIEKLLSVLDPSQGYALQRCSICGASYRLPAPDKVANLREAHLCHDCGGSRRSIDLARVLLKVIGSNARCLREAADDLRKLKIYLLESYGPIHAVLSNSPDFTCSEYWDDVRPGERRDNVRCEDVQSLTFPDASFEIVLDQDIFEHVANPEAGFREIHRVLRPGGYHVFTVPLNRSLAKSVARARMEGNRIAHLLPAVYHGDRLRSRGSLVFTDFGSDLTDRLEKTGFEVETYEDEHPEYPAGYNAVFVCRKK